MGDTFNIDFTGKDYAGLLVQADAFAKSLLPEWTARDDNDVNWVTIKTIAFLVSKGMFYIDLAYNEQDPIEVQIYRNALRLARKYGMLPKKFSGAKTDLTIEVKPHVGTFILVGGTVFKMANGDKYSLLEAITYPDGVASLPGNVQYGEKVREILGTSDGTKFQSFEVQNDMVQDGSVRIFIDEGLGEQEWEQTDSLVMSYETDPHFRLMLEENERYTVNFGDDKSGKIPGSGKTIYIEYLTMPSLYVARNYGNVPEANITVSESADVKTVTQTNPATGGAPKETLAELSFAIPQWIATAGKVTGTVDAEYLSRRVAGVQDARCFVSAFVFSLYVIPVGGGVASNPLKDAVFAYLRPRTMPQIELNILSPEPVLVNFSADIEVEDNYKRNDVKSKVNDAVIAFLDQPTNVGRVVTLMDAYAVLKSVAGVKIATLTKLYKGTTPALGNVTLAISQVSAKGTIVLNATGGIV